MKKKSSFNPHLLNLPLPFGSENSEIEPGSIDTFTVDLEALSDASSVSSGLFKSKYTLKAA